MNKLEIKKGQSNALLHLAEINYETNNWAEASQYCQESFQIKRNGGNKKGQVEALLLLSQLQKSSQIKSDQTKEILTLKEALSLAEKINSSTLLTQAHYALFEHYKLNKAFEKSLNHPELYQSIEKKQHKNMLDQKILNLNITHHAQEVEKEAEIYRLKTVDLVELNKKIEVQKETVENTLQELIDTQNQLIQSEKMASLGELTAGIAHEIQNPLNFVTNFSQVNIELIDELIEEITSARSTPEVLADGSPFGDHATDIIDLAKDIKSNKEKIKHHRGRADSIVKGMLQHSRTNSGEKVPTDINALAEEYLRLPYHGLRAKDNAFNATMETDFDDSIGKINVIPQDIGRVLPNLITNALQACAARSRSAVSSTPLRDQQNYQPLVTITTKRADSPLLDPAQNRREGAGGGGENGLVITITDNGPGIPESIKDKIFQPFFTTKATGEGTGLGLSLAYDIIKTHGGELKVKSEEGKGSEFIISIPI